MYGDSYEELERRWIAETTPGWRWCLNPSCRSGQVHETSSPPASKPEEGKEEQEPAKPRRSLFQDIFGTLHPTKSSLELASPPNPDIFTCKSCGASACVPCNRPRHLGETCAQYQARVKDRMEEEEASLKELQKHSKQCPKCSRPIQKSRGCNHMHCTQCKVDFCWGCASVIGVEGRYCLCYPNGPGH